MGTARAPVAGSGCSCPICTCFVSNPQFPLSLISVMIELLHMIFSWAYSIMTKTELANTQTGYPVIGQTYNKYSFNALIYNSPILLGSVFFLTM